MTGSSVFFILAVGFSTATVITGAVTCSDDASGFIPHESDCAKFYQCTDGQQILAICPQGLHFNPAANACDWPQNVECHSNISSSNDDNNVTCPPVEEDPEEDILIPHPSDCTKFYKCTFGRPELQDCPEGLHFNPEIQACDWPENANCSNSNNNGNENGNETAPNIVVCPEDAEDPKDPIILSHPSICSKFYICSHGVAYEFDCPDTLYYNPDKRECDYPANTNCTNNSNGNGSNTGNENIGSGNNGNGNNGSENNNNGNTEGTSPNITCPSVEENPEVDILFPHPSNCSQFYLCSHGVRVENDCGNGLYFNPEIRGCDYPENTNCTNSNSGNKNNGNGNNGTGNNGNENNGNGNNGSENNNNGNTEGTSPNITCPSVEEDPEVDILFPHPSNCSKFYLCSHGVPVENDCGNGLYYNPEIRGCDYPENTNCTNSNSGNENNGNGNNGTGNNGNGNNGNGSENNNNGNTEGTSPNITCPSVEEDPEVDILFPHPSNCSKFYLCSHGIPVENDCGNGLYYNPEIRGCDYPENTNCTNSNSGNENNSNGNNGTGNNGNGNNGNDNENNNNGNTEGTSPNITCPSVEEDPEVDILFPHPSNCSKFYLCSHGVPVENNCGNGLYYNPEIRGCDYPENTNCTNSNSGNENNGNGNNGTGNNGNGNNGNGSENNNNGNTEGTSPNITCPSVEEDPEVDILFPHPSNCSKFYLCSHGVPVENDCSNGLYYNPEIRGCDYPENTNCTNSNSGNENNDNGNNGTGNNGNGNNGNGSENNNNGNTEGPSPNITCPSVEEDPEVDILFPHPSNCSKFYLCNHGVPVENNCGNGLYYNPEIRGCDYPENTNCTNSNSGNENNGNGNNGTGNNGNGNNGNGNNGSENNNNGNTEGTSPNITCPSVEEDPEVDILFPHPSNCSKYYLCSHGVPVENDCGNGLYFNPEIRGCNYPENTNCTNNNNGTNNEDTGNENNGNGNNGSSNGNNAIVSPNITCPVVTEDPEDDILLEHPSSCSKFYICSHGVPVEHDCVKGLYYNSETKECDYPENTNCTDNSSGNENNENENNGNGNGNNGNSNGGTSPNTTCPTVDEDPEYDILFAHPTNCSKFYLCSHGVPVEHDCVEGLYYNTEMGGCDWPENTNCTNNNSGNENNSNESNENNSNNGNGNEGEISPNVTCPAVPEDPEEDILLPHPSDCTKFYKCTFGVAKLQDCPEGLYYNQEEKQCDWPQNTNCTMNVATRKLNLLPHETNCSKFYLSFNGVLFEYNCPTGLNFNADTGVCQYMPNSNCQKQSVVDHSKEYNKNFNYNKVAN